MRRDNAYVFITPKWWEADSISYNLRRLVTRLGPPKQAFDADRLADGLRATIRSIEDPDDLDIAGLSLRDVLRELDGLGRLAAPASPALLAWRTPIPWHLTAYWTFASQQEGWRAHALRRHQAILLYLMTLTNSHGVHNWRDVGEMLHIGTKMGWMDNVTRSAVVLSKDLCYASEFPEAQYFICTPERFTLREWARAIRSIDKFLPARPDRKSAPYFSAIVDYIERLPENIGTRQIDVGPGRTRVSVQIQLPFENVLEQPHQDRTGLPDSARTLLTNCGVDHPGEVDLPSFAKNALASLASTPKDEQDTAAFVGLTKTLTSLETLGGSLPPISPDYPDWRESSAPMLYRSVLDPAASQPCTPSSRITSICLRAAFLPPPDHPSERDNWVQAIKEVNAIAEAVSWHAPTPPTSGIAEIISCISAGAELPTAVAINNLRALNTSDTETTRSRDALALVLSRLLDSLNEKAEPEEEAEQQAPTSRWIGLSIGPIATRFFERIGISGQLINDLHPLRDTLSELRKLDIGEFKDRPLSMIDDVLAALDQILPLVDECEDRTTSANRTSECIELDALTLQPGEPLREGIRKLQILLLQHACSAEQSHYTKTVGKTFAKLIINISQLTDETLVEETRRYLLHEIPPTPRKSKSFRYLYTKYNRKALDKSDIDTMRLVLQSIQSDRKSEEDAQKKSAKRRSPTDASRQPARGERPICPTDSRGRNPDKPRNRLAFKEGISEERAPRVTTVRAPVRAPTSDELSQIQESGGTIDDILPETDATIIEARPNRMGVAQRRAFASRQASAMRQGVWARHQWDAMTAEESSDFIRLLLVNAESKFNAPGYKNLEAFTACGLMAATGFSLPRVYGITLSISDPSVDDVCEVRAGALSFPLPGTDSRFEPSPAQSNLLEAASHRVRILLPLEIATLIRRLKPGKDRFLFAIGFDELSEIVTNHIQHFRRSFPRLSSARLQRSHQLEVLNQTGDIAIAQMICGDALGVATTPTAYYAAHPTTLQVAYNTAIQRIGLSPKAPDDSATGRVGSKLLVTRSALAAFVSTVQRGLIQRPRDSRLLGRAAVALHEALAPSLAMLFMAGTGHRPTYRLGQMTSRHICLEAGLAVIEDKISDEQHAARLVPLSATVRDSLAAYGTHLERLTGNQSLVAAHRQAAADALSGRGPLFFMFEGHTTRALSIDDLTRCAPPHWPLPKNFLRHRLATCLRDVGCPGVYVQAMLGHLEAGIQPFGTESFMSPATYLQATSAHVEAMLKADGWKPLLGGNGDIDVFRRHAQPLTSAVIRMQLRHEQNSRSLHQRYRQHVQQIQSDHGNDINFWVEGLIDDAVSAQAASTSVQPVVLDADVVSSLRKKICADAIDLAYAEVAINALRTQLQEGSSAGRWRVKRLPHFHATRPEPSVFHPGFVSLYASVLDLRRDLRQEISGNPSTAPQDVLRRCVLALILWHGVCTEQRLLQILKGIPHARAADTLDALVVPVEFTEAATGRTKVGSEVLRGAVALFANSAKEVLTDETGPNQISTVIATWISAQTIHCPPDDVLAVLLEAAAASHRFESAGPTRAVWTGAFTSISLPPMRLLTALGSTAADTSGEEDFSVPDNNRTGDLVDQTTSAPIKRTLRGYSWLRELLYFKPGLVKTYPDYEPDEASDNVKTAATQQPATTQSEHEIRKEIIRRLEARLHRWPDDHSLLRALTGYALDRVKNGTPWKRRIELSTIYNYLVVPGSALLAQHDGTPLDEMDSEDFHELYDSCIQGSDNALPAKLARLIAYFHGYLVSHCGAPAVAIGASASGGRCLPDVGYVTPAEYIHAKDLIRTSIESSQCAPGSTTELEAANAALSLGFASGARTSEVLLREVDEVNLSSPAPALVVRRNNITRVKTPSSTRNIRLDPILTHRELRELESWKANAKLPTPDGSSKNSPFFRYWSTQLPINRDIITSIISAALRTATGATESRPYWWRHTLISNEFITQLGPADVIHALAPPKYNPTLGIGESGQSLGYPPNSVPPCQAHAANFRARRGHVSMRTSVETYVHLVALVEPWASRQLSQQLSIDAISRIANLSPSAARKRLSRCGSSADNRPAVFRTLLGGPRSDELPEQAPPPRQVKPVTRSINLESAIKALAVAVRTDDHTFPARALHMTEAEATRWKLSINAALDTNIYRNNPISWATDFVDAKDIDIVRSDRSTLRNPKRINEKWLLQCVASTQGDTAALDAWRIVMKGLDVVTGFIVVSSKDELRTLVDGLKRSFAPMIDESATDVELVTDKNTLPRTSALRIGEDVNAAELKLNHAKRFSPPIGNLNIGATIKNKRTGLTVKSPALLAALFACAWNDV